MPTLLYFNVLGIPHFLSSEDVPGMIGRLTVFKLNLGHPRSTFFYRDMAISSIMDDAS